MKVITCNMLVDYDGDRTVAQLELIKNEDPDIIMLQEVHGRRKSCVDSALVGYTTFPEFQIQESAMGCLIYCRNTLKVHGVVSRNFASSFMERGFSAVCVDNTWYMTTHLESMDKPQFEALRQRQLAEMWEFIADKNNVVIGMDSNIKADIKCPAGVSDVWKNEPTHTWFANRFFGYEATARFDRFIVKNICVNDKNVIENKFSDHDILSITSI
jgi:exonuclease III